MFEYEKHLEDYICNNQDQFIEQLKNIYGEDGKYKFIGRQVNIGRDNIADLMFYSEDTELYPDDTEYNIKTYIIVELKNRELISKDLSQLLRYKNVLLEKLKKEQKENEEICIEGLFVAPGISDELKEFFINRIPEFKYLIFSMRLDFELENLDYFYTKEYIENLKLDERIININK